MNVKPNEGGRKRSGSEWKKEVPTKKKTERAKEVEEDSESSGEEASSYSCWHDIGDKEEMFLASTREDLYEMIMHKEGYKNKELGMSTKELMRMMKSLLIYNSESVGELQSLQPEEEEAKPEERSRIGTLTALMTFQHRRVVWMVNSFLKRYQRQCERINNRERINKELKKENALLQECKEALTKERDELLGRISSQRMEVEVETKEAGVSTEIATPEVEMAEVSTLSVPPQNVPPGLVGTLEEVVERKMGEILSRVGFPMGGRSGRSENPEKSRTRTPTRDIGTWSEVVKRSKGKLPPQREAIPSHEEKRREPKPTGRSGKGMEGKSVKRKALPALPKTAAVVLTAPPGKEAACGELLRRAKEEISLEEIEVPPLEIRRSRTGGLILGVPGQHSQEGADRLACSLAGIAKDMGVRLSRPVRKADLRVSGLDESATAEDVRAAVASMTGCRASDIRCGQVRSAPAGSGTLWLQCPVDAAVKAARTGKAKVGWASVSIEMLKARPPRCFRCLEVGHIGVQCTSKIDRAHRCYRCGTEGHRTGECEAAVPRCPLCVDTDRPHKHTLGGPGCVNSIPPSRSKEGGTSAQDERATSSSAG